MYWHAWCLPAAPRGPSLPPCAALASAKLTSMQPLTGNMLSAARRCISITSVSSDVCKFCTRLYDAAELRMYPFA